jgi:hypothetical protein
MISTLTARWLKPGSYDAFRSAWNPGGADWLDTHLPLPRRLRSGRSDLVRAVQPRTRRATLTRSGSRGRDQIGFWYPSVSVDAEPAETSAGCCSRPNACRKGCERERRKSRPFRPNAARRRGPRGARRRTKTGAAQPRAPGLPELLNGEGSIGTSDAVPMCARGPFSVLQWSEDPVTSRD